jgi:hypothetical protein
MKEGSLQSTLSQSKLLIRPGFDGRERLRKPLSSTVKKLRLARAWTSRYPVWCAWQVTYRCNYYCGFCQYWRDPMGELPEQTVEQFEEGSRKLASYGSLLVSLAGVNRCSGLICPTSCGLSPDGTSPSSPRTAR